MHERGISDSALAKMTGLDRSTITRARISELPLNSSTQAVIARTLGVSPHLFWPALEDYGKSAPLHHHMVIHDISVDDIADALGVTRQAVSLWRYSKRRMKIEYVQLLNERLRIPKHILRPDIWKPPSHAAGSTGEVPPRAGSERGGLPTSSPGSRQAAAA